MLPSIENKLMNNEGFKALVLSAMGREIKTELDRLTIAGTVSNEAERLLLLWLRDKGRNGSLYEKGVTRAMSDIKYTQGVLAIFDDTAEDDIIYSVDEQGAINIDYNQSKPIVISKLKESGYLYMLAGATPADFAKTEFSNGAWIVPQV